MEIVFNQKIYSLSSVSQAVADFSHLAKFTLAENAENVTVFLTDCVQNSEITAKEFKNYVLALVCANRDI